MFFYLMWFSKFPTVTSRNNVLYDSSSIGIVSDTLLDTSAYRYSGRTLIRTALGRNACDVNLRAGVRVFLGINACDVGHT
jgi:hypothetical protein